MTDIIFHNSEYPYEDTTTLNCKNKENQDNKCDNCKSNVHLNCANYVPKNDMCLQYFELGVSEVSQYDECAEKKIYNDTDLQKKWSN